MDPTSTAIKSGEPTSSTVATPFTWPIGVQFALVLLVTASLCFIAGRWSHDGLASSPPPAQAAEPAGPALDLNRASKAELRLVPGIGDALAQRIIDYRRQAGQFRTVDELRHVKGIGEKTLKRIKPFVFVTESDESFVAKYDDDGEPMIEKAPSVPHIAAASKKLADLKEPINVNQASQAELRKLPGIGAILSQRILEVREKAAFKSVEDLRRVRGIGPKTLENIRPHVVVE